jgi:hypothetical protein
MILMSQGVDNTVPPAKPRLILHAGTPKTGSTTLQAFLHLYRQTLIDQGILYPDVGMEPHAKRVKHQWIVDDLLSGNEPRFLANQNLLLTELSSHPLVHTVVLSTEGLYYNWWDFSDAAKLLLRNMDRFFDVTVWVVFREPLSFATSLYSQAVKNPKSPRFQFYGTSDLMEMVMDDPSFFRNLHYADFVRNIEDLFGRSVVLATKYETADSIDQAMGILGIDRPIAPPLEKKNLSLSELGLEMARRVNRQNIDPAERKRYIDMIRELDALIGSDEAETAVSAEVKFKVDMLAKESRAYLKTRYRIVWD